MRLNLTSCRSNKQVGAITWLANHSRRYNVAGQSEHRRAGTLTGQDRTCFYLGGQHCSAELVWMYSSSLWLSTEFIQTLNTDPDNYYYLLSSKYQRISPQRWAKNIPANWPNMESYKGNINYPLNCSQRNHTFGQGAAYLIFHFLPKPFKCDMWEGFFQPEQSALQ